MDDFMDTLLKKEFAQAEIPDAGFSKNVMHKTLKHNRERMALIVGGLLAGTLVALISVPDIISILSVLIGNLSRASIQTISVPDAQLWLAQLQQALSNQSSILLAFGLAILTPVFLLALEE